MHILKCLLQTNHNLTSTMSTKDILKSAKACLDSKDWEGAVRNYSRFLSFEPQNYVACITNFPPPNKTCPSICAPLTLPLRHLYSGYAHSKLGALKESEESYKSALSVDKKYANQPPPWQGLFEIYEAQKDVPKYTEVATKLCTIFKDG